MSNTTPSCFTPVTDTIVASINYLGAKFGRWCRTTIQSRPADDGGHDGFHDGGDNYGLGDIDNDSEDHEYQQLLPVLEEDIYQEVADAIDTPPALPRRRRFRRRRTRSSNTNRSQMIGDTRVSQADHRIYYGMENMVRQMINHKTGVHCTSQVVGNVQLVFTGNNMILWLLKHIPTCQETDAVYLGNILASLGFLYPLDDRTLEVKKDERFYRFQSPAYWKSGAAEKDDKSYAAYLIRRQIYSSFKVYDSLTDYEAIAFDKLKTKFSTNWGRIEEEAVHDINQMETYSVEEKKVLFSEQRAFWDMHRPLGRAPRRSQFQFDYTRLLMFRPYF